MKKTYKARLLFAKNLRAIREQNYLSQEKLAELADLHRTYISSVECGARNISIDNIERLADALKTDIREFLKPDENSPP